MICHRFTNLFLFAILFLFLSTQSFCDCFLVLNKGSKNIHTFRQKDELNYLINDFWYHGTIDSIGDGFIYVANTKVFLNEITCLKFYRNSFNYNADGIMLMAGSVFFVAIDAADDLVKKQRINISKNTLILSSVLLAAGISMELLATKTYHLGHKFSFKTICV